jgi:hypothetical protein
VAFVTKFILVVLVGSPVFSAKALLEFGARLVAAAGLLLLVKFWMGVTVGFPFSTVGDALLDLYDAAVEWCLQWAEPCMRRLLESWFPSLTLEAHWRSVTTLTALYMSRSVFAAATTEMRFLDRRGRTVVWGGDKLCAIWRAFFGAFLALAAGASVGLLASVGETRNGWPSVVLSFANAYLFVLLPVAAITLYHFCGGVFQALFRKYLELSRRPNIRSRLGILLGHSKAALRRSADVLIWPRHVSGVIFYAPLVLVVGYTTHLPQPGFAALLAFVVFLGLHFSREGKEQALKQGGDWRDAYFAQGSAKIGTSILGALIWALIALGIDWLLRDNGQASTPAPNLPGNALA